MASSSVHDAIIDPSAVDLWKTRKDRARFQWSSLAMLSPAFALLIILFLIPVGYAVYLGFTNLTLVGPTAVHWFYTGTQNLQRLGSDTEFRSSLELTAFFVIGSIVGVLIVGYGLASLLLRATPWVRVLVGGVVVIAWMMPAITAGMTWYASTTAQGTFATLIGLSNSDFLGSYPLLIVTIANIWSQTGFAMLVIGAALRNIPSEILEAADVENASKFQRFRLVVLPMLRPTMTAVVLLVALLSLANFSLIYVMTQGGPGNATNILPLYSYQQAFEFNNLAYGALIGNVMVIIAAVFGVLYVRVATKRSK
ncbi:MAG TPA: sugar ABC transporter permease [Acidimicrobiales bacterium]|nr:sugar ABC transporter permease [Acidimicrobiales bacterium]